MEPAALRSDWCDSHSPATAASQPAHRMVWGETSSNWRNGMTVNDHLNRWLPTRREQQWRAVS